MADTYTFEDYDKLERKDFADRLTKAISKLYPFTNEAFVLSLHAPWGTGKTTFLRMWQHDLKQQNYKVLYLNAWETDFDDEPLIPIISSLIEGIGSVEKELNNTLKGALAGSMLAISQALEMFTSVSITPIVDAYKKGAESDNIITLGNSIYQAHSFKKAAYNQLKERLLAYISTLPKKPLIIMVDELDRVRPDYAVKFLEAIKHIFPIQGICFILAVDRVQLEKSVRQLYGDIDFENYYRRFITREVELPAAHTSELAPFIEQQISRYLTQLPLLANNHIHPTFMVMAVCIAFGFTAREIEYLVRILAQFIAVDKDFNSTNREMLKEFRSIIDATIILLSLFIKHRDLYHQVGAGQLTPRELYDYLNSFPIIKEEHRSADTNGYTILKSMMFMETELNEEEITGILLEYYRRHSNMEIQSDCRRAIDSIRKKKHISHIKHGFGYLYTHLESWMDFLE